MNKEKKIIMNFLEANNWFSLEDKENAEGVVNCYFKFYKIEKNIFIKLIINILKSISAFFLAPFILIYFIIDGFLEIGAEIYDDIIELIKK